MTGYLEDMKAAYGPNPFSVADVLAVARKAIELTKPELTAQECDSLARKAAVMVLDTD